jgi:hypothetical protein
MPSMTRSAWPTPYWRLWGAGITKAVDREVVTTNRSRRPAAEA